MRLLRLLPLVSAGIFLAFVLVLAAQDNGVPSSLATPSANQSAQSESPATVIRTATKLVLLDVVVEGHNGHPISNLKPESFHIFEDGREQAIKTFEEHSPADNVSLVANAGALPPNTYSNLPDGNMGSAINVLLLDAVNTSLADQAYARRKIIEYLKNIPPGTRIAIFTLASRLRLIQGFTADSTVLLATMDKMAPKSSALSANGGESAAGRVATFQAGQSSILPGTTPTQMESAQQKLQQFEADEANLLDRRVQVTLDAMKQLALYLGALPGRKNVVWVSASFPLSLTPESPLDPVKEQHEYGPQLQQVSDLLTASRVAVYPVDARGLMTAPARMRQNRPAASVLASRGTPISDPNAFPSHPVPVTDRANAELATMQQLAEQTGGTPYYAGNAIKEAIAKAIENGSSYYTLAYSPEDKNFQGRFRKIQVKLSGHDYHLAYRHGYFADPPAAYKGDTSLTAASPALQPDAPPSAQIFFRARILSADDAAAENLQAQPGPAGVLGAKLKPPVKRYWIEYTADMHQVSAETDDGGVHHSVLEFLVLAYDRDGKMVNASRRAFKLGLPPAIYDEFLQKGYTVRSELDLPAGDIWLRLAVHDLAADRVGSIQVPVKIVTKNAD